MFDIPQITTNDTTNNNNFYYYNNTNNNITTNSSSAENLSSMPPALTSFLNLHVYNSSNNNSISSNNNKNSFNLNLNSITESSLSSSFLSNSTSTSPLMLSMEPELLDFKSRAVMIFLYTGYVFLAAILFTTFIVSSYWSISDACYNSKQKKKDKLHKIINSDINGGGGNLDLEAARRSSIEAKQVYVPEVLQLQQQQQPCSSQSVSGSSSCSSSSSCNDSNNGGRTSNNNIISSMKKSKRKISPKSLKYNDIGHNDEESVNCELLDWDRQTEVIEMDEI